MQNNIFLGLCNGLYRMLFLYILFIYLFIYLLLLLRSKPEQSELKGTISMGESGEEKKQENKEKWE